MQISAAGSGLAPLSTLAGATAAVTGAATAGGLTAQTASNAFGLNFESLLKIILTQLTYQDPLKPMDNFQFVSQLAQFSQIQQGQEISDKLSTLVSAQSASQVTGLLGQEVDVVITGQNQILSGTVRAISFQNGDPRLTIETSTGQTISNIAPGSVSAIREGN